MEPADFLQFTADFSAPHIVAAYDEAPLWSALFGQLLLDEVPLRDMRIALDVGSGTGFPLIELAERLGPGSQVHGVDPWSGGMARAAEKVAARATPNVTLHEAAASAMPFADQTFDLIVSNLGINNFDDRTGAIRECHRVAKAGSMIALTTNLRGHMREFYETFDEVLTEAGDTDGRARLRDHVAHRATVADIRGLLEQGGFAVTRVVDRHASMRFADGSSLFRHHFIKLGFLDGWKHVVPGRERTIFARLETALNDFARRHGELRLTIPMAYVEAIAR